jgi:hypothetical protein
MARTAATGFWSLSRAWARAVRCWPDGPRWLAAGLVLIGLMFPGISRADPVKGEASFTASGGFARLVLTLAEDVEPEVTAAGSIVVIRFKRPVEIPVERIGNAVPDYIGSARRDPDGTAIRLSLARRVTINTMNAGEKVFVDLLPDSWTGPPPGLPPEVIRQLAERARAAERELRLQRVANEAKRRAPIRVRALLQPTFVRFVFDMPDGVGVSSVLNDQNLTLSFDAALNFDLADAKISAPSNIASISQKLDTDSSAVTMTLIGNVDVHSFREDKSYNVDVAFQQAEKPLTPLADAAHALASPAPSAPAAAAAMAPTTPAPMAAATPPPAPMAPATAAPMASEKFAKEANVEIKPEAPPHHRWRPRLRSSRLRPPKRRLPHHRRRRPRQRLPRPRRRLRPRAPTAPHRSTPGATAKACA